MLTKCLLIDQYQTETRIAIVKNKILEDFDYEVLPHKLKKGNIYKARVMRVEPSLQAAFLDFGSEKHGFLAFSEIHPCYYHTDKKPPVCVDPPTELEPVQDTVTEQKGELESVQCIDSIQKEEPESAQDVEAQQKGEEEEGSGGDEEGLRPKPKVSDHYRIQDVIKKNQMMWVQITKDSRGTKGAALTTYISLPGRYSVLLANTPDSSGISRKITTSSDRESIKEIISTLEIPPEMSIIVRTAGLGRKKGEIKRDCDYLIRLWDTISKKDVPGPALVYEEQDLLIRALRDLYTPDTDKIWIQGEQAFKKARAFMKVFMPSHVKRVHLYEESFPSLFEKFEIEGQIEAVYDHSVTLPSGGSVVIDPTEALVAIDVNSAKSIHQKNSEDTALKTNLEAAEAVARHLRLRDLAGLIVIDFIDMPAHKNAQVEKALKEALKLDRARLKVGKISGFGLLEMSRQRMRQSLIETHTTLCSACQGTGRTISASETAMKILRALENQQPIPVERGPLPIKIAMASELALFFLNTYRNILHELENRIGISLTIDIDPMAKSSEFKIEGFDSLPPGEEVPPMEKKEKQASHRYTKPKNHKPQASPSQSPVPAAPLKEKAAAKDSKENKGPVKQNSREGNVILLPTIKRGWKKTSDS